MTDTELEQHIAMAERGDLKSQAAALRELMSRLAAANAEIADLDARVTDLENA